jgi:hypothetical protein
MSVALYAWGTPPRPPTAVVAKKESPQMRTEVAGEMYCPWGPVSSTGAGVVLGMVTVYSWAVGPEEPIRRVPSETPTEG